MTPDEFATALRVYCQALGGSITSWGRTVKHNAAVGGVPTSRHVAWCGADVVYDAPIDVGVRRAKAQALNLQLIVESDHDHLQDHK
jgi:hypothetical protein